MLCLTLMSCLPELGAEPVTNLSIRLLQPNFMELSWPDQGESSRYTVQWTGKVPAERWLPMRPWTQWPVSDLSYGAGIELGSARYFRVESVRRGRVLSHALQQSYTLFQIQVILSFSGLDVGVTPVYGVDVHRIEYETLDPWLGASSASGILILPSEVGASVPLVSYQHGTIFERTGAPSSPTSFERLVGVIAASTGYAVAMSDYWGLGEGSSGLHPYALVRANATPVVDFLRAAGTVAAELDENALNDQLFLTGYSFGGQVTLAAQREIEQRHAAEFVITASAPMEGPYDLSETMFEILFADEPYITPEYFPYLIFSYNSVYQFYSDPAEVFQEPYASTLPALFDGTRPGSDVAEVMPEIPSQILRPEVLGAVRSDPNHPLRVALQENDLLGWKPLSPTRLVHCSSDVTVPVANTEKAYASFLAAGATQVEWVDPDPSGDHDTCLEPAAREVLGWFESLRGQ